MIVFSPLALYTTYLGWQIYDLIFDAFLQTGLWFLGFLYIAFRFFKNLAAPAGMTNQVAEHALNHFIYELLVLVIMLAVFVIPTVTLPIESFEFNPLCTSLAQTKKIGNTGSTYDENFQSLLNDEIKIPLGFAFLQNFIGGLTYGLMQASTCVDGLNHIRSDLISTRLPEEMQEELGLFKEQCFLEARFNFKARPPKKETYKNILNLYGGENDLTWLGSHVLRKFYYSKIKARSPVNRYSYNQFPSENVERALQNKEIERSHLPEHGFPNCESWWVDIREDLKKLSEDPGFLNASFSNLQIYRRISNALAEKRVSGYRYAPSGEAARDIIAKILIENHEKLLAKQGVSLKTNNNLVQSYLATGINRGTQAIKSWTSTPIKREAIRQTLPVIQALATFFVILLMPLILVFSGCNPKAIGAFCGIFCALIFSNFIWFQGNMLESRLLESLDANGELISVIQNTALMFYFIGPLLFLRFSALWGAGSADFLTQVVGDSEKQANEIGRDSKSYGNTAISLGSKLI